MDLIRALVMDSLEGFYKPEYSFSWGQIKYRKSKRILKVDRCMSIQAALFAKCITPLLIENKSQALLYKEDLVYSQQEASLGQL